MTINNSCAVVGYDDYYPFGVIMPGRSQVSSSDNKYKFTSKERDTETGYDYFGARCYDSRIGRWLSVDPHQTIQNAESEMNRFVSTQTSLYIQSDNLYELGLGFHTLMDQNSPTHSGFQVWNGNPNFDPFFAENPQILIGAIEHTLGESLIKSKQMYEAAMKIKTQYVY